MSQPTQCDAGGGGTARLWTSDVWFRTVRRVRVLVGGASVLLALFVVAGLVVATRGSDEVTSDAERDRAIDRIADGFDMSRAEVVRTAGAFCEAVELSDDLDDYASFLRPAFKDRAEFLFADSTETMVRIGRCEKEFFAIGGTFGEDTPGMRRLDGLMSSDRDPLPSTPAPEIGTGGPATLSLDTGEELQLAATCSAGRGSRDYTVAADDGVVRVDLAAVGVSDSDGQWYNLTVFDEATGDVLWDTDSLSGNLDVRVDGSSVVATADLRPAGDPNAETVGAELRASC